MSFSNEVKKELSSLKINNKLEALLELSSILKVNASISIRKAFININFTTESEYVVKRIYSLIDYLYNYECTISKLENNNLMRQGLYSLSIEDESVVNKITSDSGFDLYGNYTTDINVLLSRILSSKEKGIGAFLRGIFIGAGSIVDPNKNYHLEVILTSDEDVDLLHKVLDKIEIESLYNKRKDKNIVYIKNSEMIANFLNIIEANKAMLELENIKIEKDLRNNINRRMNFDMANINKVVETSLKQIADIELIEEKGEMPESLKEMANIRKEFPDYSLKQLAEEFSPPISKSRVSYILKIISEIAEKLK